MRWFSGLASIIAATAVGCAIFSRSPSASATVLFASVGFATLIVGDLLVHIQGSDAVADRWQLFSRVTSAGAAFGVSCAAALRADLSPTYTAIAVGAALTAAVRIASGEYESYLLRFIEPHDERSELKRETLARRYLSIRRWTLTAAGYGVLVVGVLPWYLSLGDGLLDRVVLSICLGLSPVFLARTITNYDARIKGLSRVQPGDPRQLRMNLQRRVLSPDERKATEDRMVESDLRWWTSSSLIVTVVFVSMASLGLRLDDATFWILMVSFSSALFLATRMLAEPLLRKWARDEIARDERESA
jgi:hypothetical protein